MATRPNALLLIGKKSPDLPPRPMVKATGGRPPGSSSSPTDPDMDSEADASQTAPGGGGKATAEEAHVVRADKHCSQCENYHADSGECDKVEGTFQPEDACIRYFKAGGGASSQGDGSLAGSDYASSPSGGGSMALNSAAGS